MEQGKAQRFFGSKEAAHPPTPADPHPCGKASGTDTKRDSSSEKENVHGSLAPVTKSRAPQPGIRSGNGSRSLSAVLGFQGSVFSKVEAPVKKRA